LFVNFFIYRIMGGKVKNKMQTGTGEAGYFFGKAGAEQGWTQGQGFGERDIFRAGRLRKENPQRQA
jgi:hypothetical protein